MTESGEQIERLQAERVRLVKRLHTTSNLVIFHQQRAASIALRLEKVDGKLDALLDAKLSTVDTIQRESGEWDATTENN